MRRAAVGERDEGDLSGGVLGLTEGGAVVRALEDLAVEVNGGFESRRVVWTFPYAGIRGKVEAAPLRQLLQLVLVHFAFPSRFFPPIPSLPLSLCQTVFLFLLVQKGNGDPIGSAENGSGKIKVFI